MAPPPLPASPSPLPTSGPIPTTRWVYILYGSDGASYSVETTNSEVAFRDYTANLGQYTTLSSAAAVLPTSSPPSVTPTSVIPSVTPTVTPSVTQSPTPDSSTPQPLILASTTTSGSTASHPQSGTSAPQATGPAAPSPSSHGLSDGTVAGIVIGVAVGLALLTFLATFLCLRRRRGSNNKGERGVLERGAMGQHYKDSEPKAPLVSETTSGSASLDTFLPQSADDMTVRNNVKTTLDQIELHVENFYQNTSVSGARPAEAELATFNSPYLSSSLAALLPKTNNRVLVIKHALAQFVTSSISATAGPDRSLLPEEFVLLPSTIQSTSSSRTKKPGFSQSMSRWRVLTAYLRPNPSDDTAYIAHRDHQIKEMVLVFSRAFAPWQNLKYKDDDRVRSLSAIFKDAAGLGIWMFSQPSDLHFQWPRHSDIGSNMVAIAPALVKLTDERGQMLSEPQVIFKMAARKVQG